MLELGTHIIHGKHFLVLLSQSTPGFSGVLWESAVQQHLTLVKQLNFFSSKKKSFGKKKELDQRIKNTLYKNVIGS
jgi:hypothetical protein